MKDITNRCPLLIGVGYTSKEFFGVFRPQNLILLENMKMHIHGDVQVMYSLFMWSYNMRRKLSVQLGKGKHISCLLTDGSTGSAGESAYNNSVTIEAEYHKI